MARVVADRVRETTTTTGTGDITLAGAVTGFRAASAVCSVGDTFDYAAVGGAEWEVGLGTYSATNTLTRTTVRASSNAGAAVSFSAGTKDVFLTVSAKTAEQAAVTGHPGYASGRFYPLYVGTSSGSDAVLTNTLALFPFMLAESVTISSLYIQVGTGTTSSSAKMAIWANSGGQPTGVPLLGNNSGVSTTTTGIKSQAIANVVLPPGQYWAGSKFTAGATPPSCTDTASTGRIELAFLTGSTTATFAISTGLTTASTYTNNIMTTDLTSATFAIGTSVVPIIGMGVA